MLKKNKYLFHLNGSDVTCLKWDEIMQLMCYGSSHNILYNYYSQYTHPSQFTVSQFSNMLMIDNELFLKKVCFDIWITAESLSMFIADYIFLFPSVLNTFEKLDNLGQNVINSYNVFARGTPYSINDSWNAFWD